MSTLRRQCPRRRVDRVVGVGDDVPHVVDADHREGHHRIAELEGEAGEPDPLAPDQRVVITPPPGHLATAAGEYEHGLAGAQQPPRVLARTVDGPEAGEQVAPERHPEVLALAERADEHTGLVVDPEDHERDVEHAERRVVADEQVTAVRRQVRVAVHPRVGQGAPRRQQRLRGGELGGPGGGEGLGIGHGIRVCRPGACVVSCSASASATWSTGRCSSCRRCCRSWPG